jgi:hypothetical protein
MVSYARRTGWWRRHRLLAAVALTLYAALMAVSPVLCHDLACHLKSATHCDACLAHPSASPAEARTSLDAPALVAAGETPCHDDHREEQGRAARTSGRSPPA